MPSGRIMSCAAYLDPYCYIFGGQDQTGILGDIVRFDPETGDVEVMAVSLPDVRMGSSAVTVGDSIYVIGGRNVMGHQNTSYRFTPDSGASAAGPGGGPGGTVEVAAQLQATGGGRVAVYDGERIIMAGGCGENCASDSVYEYDPATGEDRLLDVTLPRGVYWTTGVWTGEGVLVFGGNDYQVSVDEVLFIVPDGEGGGELEVVGNLPHPLELGVSFWDGETAWLMGGVNGLDASDAIYTISVGEEGGGDNDGDDAIPGLSFPLAAAGLAFGVGALFIAGRRLRRWAPFFLTSQGHIPTTTSTEATVATRQKMLRSSGGM
jgi:hypothetical protein